MIKMWNIAQPICSNPATEPNIKPAPYMVAIKIKTISPAYILPNKRKPNENGLASNVTVSKTKLTGNAILPKGSNANSPRKPPAPLILKL